MVEVGWRGEGVWWVRARARARGGKSKITSIKNTQHGGQLFSHSYQS